MKVNAIPAAVYVAKNRYWVKIGRSKRPESRVRQLSLAHGAELNLVYATEVRRDASAVESCAHTLLSSKRLCGEWFDVNSDVAVDAVRRAIEVADCAGCRPEPIFVRKTQVSQSRIGKKSVTIWIDEDLAEEVKIAAIRAGESQQDWFANAAQQRLARERSG